MKITATMFLSLDGVYQGPGSPDEDRTGGFEQGGWQIPFADEDMGRYITEGFNAADAFLLGRKTYEIWAAVWPEMTDDPLGELLNKLPKYVASTTLESAAWNNSTLLKENVVEDVAELKRRPGRELQIHGSGDLAQSLMAHDLIDEFRLWVHPVVLGGGKRLFDTGTRPAGLKLTDCKTTGSGLVYCIYGHAGRPPHGS